MAYIESVAARSSGATRGNPDGARRPPGATGRPAPATPKEQAWQQAQSAERRRPARAIETHGLTKRFGARTAIDGVDLRSPGCAFGFLGPNGAGKTTMIRMLLGLTDATAGTMRLLGRPVPAERDDALQRVGAIVEEPRFHAHLSGRENLRIVAAVRGPKSARIEPALARVGLAARGDKRVARYSLGMRQRLGVARCLLADPRS